MKTLLLSAILVTALSSTVPSTLALAQSADPGTSSDTRSSGIRSGNVTSTGATVPNPGASQSAGTTDLDRGIQRQDTQIENSICKGC